MLLGLDHIVIAVRDLSRASEQLQQALGLTVSPGGEHPGFGTHNAIARFGTEYLELIAVRDPEEARSTDRGRALLDFLSRREGLAGFALDSDDLERDMSEARARGFPLEGPFPGSRRRPDGRVMTWKTARVPGDLWGRKMPFLIQHDVSMQERQALAPPGGHPLRTTGIPSVSLAVADVDDSCGSYRRLLGEPPEVVEDVPALPARRARFRVGRLKLELLQPAARGGGLADFVREEGDGLFMISLAVPNVDEAVQFLRSRGTSVGNPTFRRRAPLLDHSQTLGARFQLLLRFPLRAVQLEEVAGATIALVLLVNEYQLPLLEGPEPVLPFDGHQTLSAVAGEVEAQDPGAVAALGPGHGGRLSPSLLGPLPDHLVAAGRQRLARMVLVLVR